MFDKYNSILQDVNNRAYKDTPMSVIYMDFQKTIEGVTQSYY